MVAQGIISIYTGGVMKEFAKSAIFQRFWGHFHIVKLVQQKCQNQLAISNIKHPKPKYLLFLGVTYIHPCLKQLRYQKKLQVTHPKKARFRSLNVLFNSVSFILFLFVSSVKSVSRPMASTTTKILTKKFHFPT